MSAVLGFVVEHPFATVLGLLGIGLTGLAALAVIPEQTLLLDLDPEESEP